MFPTNRQRLRPCRYKIGRKIGQRDCLGIRATTHLCVEIPLQQDQRLQAANRDPKIRLHCQCKLKELLMRREILQRVRRRLVRSPVHGFVVDGKTTQRKDEVHRAKESRIVLRDQGHRRWRLVSVEGRAMHPTRTGIPVLQRVVQGIQPDVELLRNEHRPMVVESVKVLLDDDARRLTVPWQTEREAVSLDRRVEGERAGGELGGGGGRLWWHDVSGELRAC